MWWISSLVFAFLLQKGTVGQRVQGVGEVAKVTLFIIAIVVGTVAWHFLGILIYIFDGFYTQNLVLLVAGVTLIYLGWIGRSQYCSNGYNSWYAPHGRVFYPIIGLMLLWFLFGNCYQHFIVGNPGYFMLMVLPDAATSQTHD